MTAGSPGSAVLVALNRGLPPHAEPLVGDELSGPNSIFGLSTRVLKPIRNWRPDSRCNPQGFARAGLYEDSVVLWENREGPSTACRARRIASAEWPDGLDVPASTFIAGMSTSSFSLAWELFQDGALPEWGGVLCSCQSRGRGQMGRRWHSPRGNLHATFRLPRDSALSGNAAPLIAGYILVMAFRALGFPLLLKWPNDLLLDETAKVGGILLEERQGVLMAGVGVNLAETPADAELRERGATRAAVLLPEHGASGLRGTAAPGLEAERRPLAPFVVWRRLVSEALLAYIRHVRGRRLPELFTAIDDVLAWKERRVALMDGDEAVLRGCFAGLGPEGGLMLRLPHGERRECFSGSLSLV